MFNGLWTVEFIAIPGSSSGNGIIVLNNGRLLGGDDGYYYSGNYETNADNFNGTITIVRYEANSISVFGDIDHFNLTFEGKLQSTTYFEALANITGNPSIRILVKGRKRESI